MRIAIAGGTGAVGTHTVRAAERAGHEAVVLSRRSGVDLVAGRGLDLSGVDAVIDVSGTSTTSAARAQGFFEAVTSTLHRAEREANVGHHVALSIVGAAAARGRGWAGSLDDPARHPVLRVRGAGRGSARCLAHRTRHALAAGRRGLGRSSARAIGGAGARR
jgi:uncharacterized protein YbjT (DUF2867 family)